MAHTVGDGIYQLEYDLGRLAGDHRLLDQERSRFDRPPPELPADRSGNTTPDLVLAPKPEFQDKYSAWKFKLEQHGEASRPRNQFLAQSALELRRSEIALHNESRKLPPGVPLERYASNRVLRRWAEQGIWRDGRGHDNGSEPALSDSWAHETSKESGPDDHSGDGGKPDDDDDGEDGNHTTDTARIDGIDDGGLASIQETGQAIFSGSEPSRPLCQFLYQVHKEREWIQECAHASRDWKFPTTITDDINTQAYEAVKKRWKTWHIWNKRWGDLPGLSWRHEMPFEELLRQKLEDKPTASVEKASASGRRTSVSTSERRASVGSDTTFRSTISSEDEEEHERMVLNPDYVFGGNSLVSLASEVDTPKHPMTPARTALAKLLSFLLPDGSVMGKTENPLGLRQRIKQAFPPFGGKNSDTRVAEFKIWKYTVSLDRDDTGTK